jgi:hypothetical protein
VADETDGLLVLCRLDAVEIALPEVEAALDAEDRPEGDPLREAVARVRNALGEAKAMAALVI